MIFFTTQNKNMTKKGETRFGKVRYEKYVGDIASKLFPKKKLASNTRSLISALIENTASRVIQRSFNLTDARGVMTVKGKDCDHAIQTLFPVKLALAIEQFNKPRKLKSLKLSSKRALERISKKIKENKAKLST
jgi:histone H3/H4